MSQTDIRVRMSESWIEIDANVTPSLEIIKEFAVKEFIADGYDLANTVKMNSNGNPYLLCIDKQENKKAALYMFKHLSVNVKENQRFRANDISIYYVKDDKGSYGLVIGEPGFKGGLSFAW